MQQVEKTPLIKTVPLFIFLMLFLQITLLTQPISDSLYIALKYSTEENRVDILNQISKNYEYENPDSSFHYAMQAEIFASEIKYQKGLALAIKNKGNYYVRTGDYEKAIIEYDLAIKIYSAENDKEGLQTVLNNKGNAYRISGDYDQALFNFLASLKICEEEGFQQGIAYASLNIGIIYATRQGEKESNGLPYFLDALKICQEINDQRCIAYSIRSIAMVYTGLKEYDKALEYHQQSLDISRINQDKSSIASSLGSIADVYNLKKDYENAIMYNQQALEISREIDDMNDMIYNLLEIGKMYFSMSKFDKAAPYLEEARSNIKNIKSLQLKSGIYQYLYEFHLAKKEYEKALNFYVKYIELEDSIYTESSNEQIAQMRTIYETEKKEAEIVQLNNEKTIQELKLRKSENLKLSFIIASILTLLLASFVYYGFIQKQKSNKLLVERNKFEIENKKRAISLFGQQVSKEVALELLSNSFKSGSKKLFACIMFLDIRGFTPFVENKEPSEIIQYQNDVFGFMIDIISKHHGIINQFLGDGFMATFGAPASSGNDTQNAVNASVEIVKLLNEKCELEELPQTKIGIGLHAGNIVTGNVGTSDRKQYSITGNTVILASRIEQLNKKYDSEILISKEVLEQLDSSQLKMEDLGTTIMKGRAEPIQLFKLI